MLISHTRVALWSMTGTFERTVLRFVREFQPGRILAEFRLVYKRRAAQIRYLAGLRKHPFRLVQSYRHLVRQIVRQDADLLPERGGLGHAELRARLERAGASDDRIAGKPLHDRLAAVAR